MGGAGLPVRARPHTCPAACPGRARGSGQVLFQPHARFGEGGHVPAGGGTFLRPGGGRSDLGVGVVVAGAAQGVERPQGGGGAVVGRMQQGGLQHRAGCAGPRAAGVGHVAVRTAGRRGGRVPQVQGPGTVWRLGAVHHRGDPGRGGPAARHAAAPGGAQSGRLGSWPAGSRRERPGSCRPPSPATARGAGIARSR